MENCKLKSEEDNINNVIYNNDTSNYKDITYNKKDETIKLFNKFDEYIISIGKDIVRNYLLKTVVYKLKIRKDYENTSLSYYLLVEDINNLEYAFELAKKLYHYLKKTQEPICELLFKNILK